MTSSGLAIPAAQKASHRRLSYSLSPTKVQIRHDQGESGPADPVSVDDVLLSWKIANELASAEVVSRIDKVV